MKMNTRPLERVTPIEDTLQEMDTLVQAGFTKDEIVSLLWLRQWYQTGGSDRVAVVRYLEFLKLLIASGRMEL
jgi:hypothetical protein